MNSDKIRRAVEITDGSVPNYEDIKPLIILAERYLAVEARMPEKEVIEEDDDGHAVNEKLAYNDAVERCTLMATKIREGIIDKVLKKMSVLYNNDLLYYKDIWWELKYAIELMSEKQS